MESIKEKTFNILKKGLVMVALIGSSGLLQSCSEIKEIEKEPEQIKQADEQAEYYRKRDEARTRAYSYQEDNYDRERVIPVTAIKPDLKKLYEQGPSVYQGYIENQFFLRKNYDQITPEQEAIFRNKDAFIQYLRNSGFHYNFKFLNYYKEEEIKELEYGADWYISIEETDERLEEAKSFIDKNFREFRRSNRRVTLPEFENNKEVDVMISRSMLYLYPESEDFGNMDLYSNSGSWHIPTIGMDRLYDKIPMNQVKVGIIDSGFYENHEDISGVTTIRNTNDAHDYDHGTAVIGTASGAIINNHKGTRAIYKTNTFFIDYKGNIVDNLEDLLDRNPKVVNISWGWAYQPWSYDELEHYDNMKDIKEDIFEKYPNTLFVIAAGNSGVDAQLDNGTYQYSYEVDNANKTIRNKALNILDNVIVVGAHDPLNTLFPYSNYGESVEIAAPSGFMANSFLQNEEGETHYYLQYDEDSCYNGYIDRYTPQEIENDLIAPSDRVCDPGYRPPFWQLSKRNFEKPNTYFNGTSASAPLVTGAAAVLWSYKPDLTPKQVKEYLIENYGTMVASRYTASQPMVEDIFPIPSLNIYNAYQKLIADYPDENDTQNCNLNNSHQFGARHTSLENFITAQQGNAYFSSSTGAVFMDGARLEDGKGFVIDRNSKKTIGEWVTGIFCNIFSVKVMMENVHIFFYMKNGYVHEDHRNQS